MDASLVTNNHVRIFTFGAAYATSTITNQSSNPIYKESPWSTFQAIITGTGAVSATVTIQATNDDATFQGTASNWVTTVLGTISLTGTTTATDGFAYVGPWKYVRATVASITGTGATVTILMGD